MSRLQEIPQEDIDLALQALEKDCASEDELAFLIFHNENDLYFHWCVDFIVDCILKQISYRKLSRWDFDPHDMRFHDYLKKKRVQSLWAVPQSWSLKNKQRILYFLIGAYRKRCHLINEHLISAFEEAVDFDQVCQLREVAIETGILFEANNQLHHNHSWVDSKLVFQAYLTAIHRVD